MCGWFKHEPERLADLRKNSELIKESENIKYTDLENIKRSFRCKKNISKIQMAIY